MNSIDSSNHTRSPKKTVNTAIAFGSTVLAACAVMMWSVFNGWTNVLTFFANEQEGQEWWITAIMVLATCVIPFGLGFWLLISTISKYKP